MQKFPDDLPLANIDADGYCCHFMRSSVRPTIHGLGFVYCIQSAWKKWPTIWHADVSRWLTLSIHGCLWILLLVCLSVHLSVCSFTAFSGGCAFAKEGGSHYWEMAVAITCGYGGYLLPLLAAHSSLKWNSCKSITKCVIRDERGIVWALINDPHLCHFLGIIVSRKHQIYQCIFCFFSTLRRYRQLHENGVILTVDPTQSISWLFMTWRHWGPGH